MNRKTFLTALFITPFAFGKTKQAPPLTERTESFSCSAVLKIRQVDLPTANALLKQGWVFIGCLHFEGYKPWYVVGRLKEPEGKQLCCFHENGMNPFENL